MRRIAQVTGTLCLFLALSIVVGCKSSTSTMMSRNECNTGWCEFKKVEGVPITVKIPTHLKMYVYDKHFLEIDSVAGSEKLSRCDLPVLKDFAHEMVYTEKVVMVDFKRPAAGASNLKVNFTEDQYIQDVQQDITDETLARVNDIVGTALPLFTQASNESTTDSIENRVKEVKSVAAVGMFEVDDPNFEMKVQQFLEQNINGQAAQSPIYGATESDQIDLASAEFMTGPIGPVAD